MFKLQLECPEILSEAWCLDNLTYYIAHDIQKRDMGDTGTII